MRPFVRNGWWPNPGLWCCACLVFALSYRAPAQHVLFIGNSLTSANGLPDMVQALARSSGETIECHAITYPDYSLEDHWARGDAQRAIATGHWTTVVLQQGPSALPESQVLLEEYTRRYDELARRVKARTALYMVWPSQVRHSDFDSVVRSYTAAARGVNGLLLPVGDAWRIVERSDSSVALYGSDGFHPTLAATYLAALVITRQLTGRLPTDHPTTIGPPLARLLQESAAEAIGKLPGR